MRRLIIFLNILLVSCGSVGKDLSEAGKCANKGTGCHDRDAPQPGPKGDRGETGPQGMPGSIGPRGYTGPKGLSCSVQSLPGGTTISCSDGTSAFIRDGIDGQNGRDAPPTPYTVTEVIDPCGSQGTYDEVLLRMSNGKLLAHYASGAAQYLTLIGPGSYITTDNTSCFFSIDSSMQIYNEHN